jgi:hypothetical protein
VGIPSLVHHCNGDRRWLFYIIVVIAGGFLI